MGSCSTCNRGALETDENNTCCKQYQSPLKTVLNWTMFSKQTINQTFTFTSYFLRRNKELKPNTPKKVPSPPRRPASTTTLA